MQLFGVFDGHGGAHCVDIVYAHFAYFFAKLISECGFTDLGTDADGHLAISNCVTAAFKSCQQLVNQNDRSGCTATVAAVSR